MEPIEKEYPLNSENNWEDYYYDGPEVDEAEVPRRQHSNYDHIRNGVARRIRRHSKWDTFDRNLMRYKTVEYFNYFMEVKKRIRESEKNINSENLMEIMHSYISDLSPTDIRIFSEDFIKERIDKKDVEFFEFLGIRGIECSSPIHELIREIFKRGGEEITTVFFKYIFEETQKIYFFEPYAEKGNTSVVNYLFETLPFEENREVFRYYLIEACHNNKVEVLRTYLIKFRVKGIIVGQEFFNEAFVKTCCCDDSYETYLEIYPMANIYHILEEDFCTAMDKCALRPGSRCFDSLIEFFDCNFKNGYGNTVFIQILINNFNTNTNPSRYYEHLEKLYYKTDCNILDSNGFSAIYYAIWLDIVWLVKLMLENNDIDKNIKFTEEEANKQHTSFYIHTLEKALDGVHIEGANNQIYRYTEKCSDDQIECALFHCGEEMYNLVRSYLPEKERAVFKI